MRDASGLLLVCLYVDDILIAHQDEEVVLRLMTALTLKYQVNDLGSPSKFLGMTIHRSKGSVDISQKVYIEEILYRNSVSGFIVYLHGCPVHWGTLKQTVVALSSTTAESIAACEGLQQAEWIRLVIAELEGSNPTEAINQQVGSLPAISRIKKDGSSNAQKAVVVRFDHVKDAHKSNKVELQYVPTVFTRVARVEHPVRVKLLPVRVALVVREVPAVVGTQCACVKSPLVLSVLAVCCLKSLLTLSGSAVPCVKSLLVLSVTTFCCVKPLLVTSVLSDPCAKSLPVVPCVKSLQLLSGWEVTCVELLRVPVERGVSA
ncbi:hypothetical protein PR003_g16457 [Phytophthora rubi]|nr:hypothetical protein PR003_g16457 [Phytophthora rubi]